MSDIENWLNQAVEESFAEHARDRQPQPAVVAPGPPNTVKALGNKGGIVRNASTKVVSQLNNPVANPKRPGDPRAVKTPTAEEEFRASNPGTVIPSMMTGMDVDASSDPMHGPKMSSDQHRNSDEPPLSWSTTLAELLQRAERRGGVYQIGHPAFVLSIKKTTSTNLPSQG